MRRLNAAVASITMFSLSLPVMAAEIDWDIEPEASVQSHSLQYQPVAEKPSLGGFSMPLPKIIPSAGPSVSTGQGALNSTAAAGTAGNTTFTTNGWGVNPTQSFNPTHSQNQNAWYNARQRPLNLPCCGTMGLAPVFGTGNDGLTSPGGYVPGYGDAPGVSIGFGLPGFGVDGASVQIYAVDH